MSEPWPGYERVLKASNSAQRQPSDIQVGLSFSAPGVLPPTEGGVKFDQGKTRYDLLAPDALDAIAKVFTYGAEKYAPRNWERGMEWGRIYAALQRHLWAFWGGEDTDPETGMLHVAHAGACIVMLLSHQQRGLGTDTRNSYPV